MVSLYEVLTDKYGDYYVSYGKKHRIKTIDKKNERIETMINNLYKNDEDFKNKLLEEHLILYKYIFLGGKKYIQFGN